MPDFTKRSSEKELLDQPNIPFEEVALNMKELNIINTYLGGHGISLSGFKSILGNQQKITVCEIGCGGGDNLFVILQYCISNNIEVSLIGIDLNSSCIAFAKENKTLLEYTQFICSDYISVSFEHKPDIIFSSLFCHHFTNDQLANQLDWMQKNSLQGFFINDLHRHWLAYYSIKFITSLFSNSRLVKNDAALSVARSFIISDWQEITKKAKIDKIDIQWKWAFRYLIIYKHS